MGRRGYKPLNLVGLIGDGWGKFPRYESGSISPLINLVFGAEHVDAEQWLEVDFL